MGFINQTTKAIDKDILDPKGQPVIATPEGDQHLNWMGGPSYDINDPILRLRAAAGSSFFGEPQYYQRDPKDTRKQRKRSVSHRSMPLSDHDVKRLGSILNAVDPQDWRGKSPADRMVCAIDAALDHDPVATMALAVELRQTANIRVTPQVIMVRAANHASAKGSGVIGKYGPQILQRLDEVVTQMAYQMGTFGKPIPSSLKRAWASRIKRASGYELAKYRLDGRQFSLVDVVNVSHPNGSNNLNELMKGTLKLGGDTRSTWESIRSEGGSWEDAAQVMGHMALRANVRNLLEAGAMNPGLCKKLVDGAPKGRQLPFRYLSAYQAIKDMQGSAPVMDALEECLEVSLGMHMPHFPGRMMCLSDNSGSAHNAFTSNMGTRSVAEIGNLMSVMTAKLADEGHVGVFGDKLESFGVRKKESLFTQVDKAGKIAGHRGSKIGAGTENGIWLFWRDAIKLKQHWDFVFVYSDMQAGHGGLYGTDPRAYSEYRWPGSRGGHAFIDVPMLIQAYRRKVNPKVQVVLVQTAGYQDTLIPETYDRTYILGGWSSEVIRYAAFMAGLPLTQQ